MGCPQCQHENRPSAKFCDECGCVLPRLWPQATLGPIADHGRPRRRLPPTRRSEIAAAIGVVLIGVAVIAGIVVGSPRWQRIIASWRASSAARSAMVSPVIGTAAEQITSPAVSGDTVRGEPLADPFVGAPGVTGLRPQSIRPDGLERQRATTVSPGIAARFAPNPAPPQPVPVKPPRAQDSARPAARSPTSAQLDAAQVMANLLIAQLGQDPAWRTALANADAQAHDSPEFAYWSRVANAIRDGRGHRARQ